MPMISGWHPSRCRDAPKERPLTSGTRTAPSAGCGGEEVDSIQSQSPELSSRRDQARRIRSVGGVALACKPAPKGVHVHGLALWAGRWRRIMPTTDNSTVTVRHEHLRACMTALTQV